MVILDDPFSALDGSTENEVVGNLLGNGGYLKKLGVTVFWVTNSGT
jgi:ATP-binding cassette, subfamily C (CFTR/MRP), member 1